MPRRMPIWFAIAAFVIGNGFVFVNPPLKAPDECAHFARAYQLASLQLIPQKQNNILGGYVPSGIPLLAIRFAKVSFDGARVAQMLDARKIPFDEHDIRFIVFPSIARYPWIPFIPQAVGIAIARPFCSSAIAVMYVAREANLVGYILLASVALRLMPECRARLALALIALLPMSLFLAASLSADAVTIAMSLIVASALWRLIFLPGRASNGDLALLLISTICLSLTKIAYMPISLLALAIPKNRLGNARRYRTLILMLPVYNCAAIILWMLQFHGMPSVDLNPAVNPAAQEQYILHHPGAILPILLHTMTLHGKEIFSGVVGSFGWNEILMPTVLVVIYAFILFIPVIASGPPLRWPVAIFAISIAAADLLAILIGFYIECRSVAEPAIDGVQGRYLIPLLPMLIFLLGAKPRFAPRLDRLLLIIAILISIFAVIFLAQEIYPGAPFSRFDFRWSD